jgi:ribonuclease HII
LALETQLWEAGTCLVAGLDEAGRGAWAGPVVAAAVILPPRPSFVSPLIGQVDDSKRLSPEARERLAPAIRACALAVGVGSVPAIDIDHVGILPATRVAMIQALAGLAVWPGFVLLDYLTLPEVHLPQRGLPHGDAISLSIAAASVIAKITRDHWMVGQEEVHRGYAFARHKGYGTAEHRAALHRLGPCRLHRLSFHPLCEMLNDREDPESGQHEGHDGLICRDQAPQAGPGR